MADTQSTSAQIAINVRYFASLRERLGVGEVQAEVPSGSTVRTVWQVATGEAAPPERLLVAINQEYVEWSRVVQAGDEVAFFPPVTGG